MKPQLWDEAHRKRMIYAFMARESILAFTHVDKFGFVDNGQIPVALRISEIMKKMNKFGIHVQYKLYKTLTWSVHILLTQMQEGQIIPDY